jgi:hypothetical protein
MKFNPPKLIATVEGCPITWDGVDIRFTARLRVDDDGTGSGHGDRCHQRDTSLHRGGVPLDADIDCYIVVPPIILFSVPPVVLGSQVMVKYKDKTAAAVVGDVGPHERLGEGSIALLRKLGINTNPNTGGDDSTNVQFIITPGVCAIVDGVHYELQRA